ncbi:hypothetical protein ACIBL3_46590 [Kribbella sp. NPDC050124]|uniref:hypothetical protein n=1 Tax=Kribbella sp. NPDC050124 TaxID=3364114 RepID=UPI0037AC6A1D
MTGKRSSLPASVAYTVTVKDPATTRRLLDANQFPVRRSAAGDALVSGVITPGKY